MLVADETVVTTTSDERFDASQPVTLVALAGARSVCEIHVHRRRPVLVTDDIDSGAVEPVCARAST